MADSGLSIFDHTRTTVTDASDLMSDSDDAITQVASAKVTVQAFLLKGRAGMVFICLQRYLREV